MLQWDIEDLNVKHIEKQEVSIRKTLGQSKTGHFEYVITPHYIK
jgi:hypothetical protein